MKLIRILGILDNYSMKTIGLSYPQIKSLAQARLE